MTVELYIIIDTNFENWQAYEVYDREVGHVVLRTEDWDKVVKFLNGNIPAPTTVEVN